MAKSSGRAAEDPAPRLRGFDRSLPMALLRGREAVMRQFRTSLRQHRITEQQWRVLRALTAVDQIEVLALAETTFLLPPSLSRILRDLDKRKLIVRRTSPDDLRRGLVSISPRGLALIEKVGAQSEAIYNEITRRFGPEKLRNLHELLARLEQVLAEPIETNDDARGAPNRRLRPMAP